MAPSISISPTLTVQVQSLTDASPKQLINIGGISFTGTVLFYNESFPVQGGAPTAPGTAIPFISDPTNKINNNAPIVYVRNLDNSAIIALTMWLPTFAGGAAAQPGTINIGPGGFILVFNPTTGTSGATIVGGSNAGAIGFGASPAGGSTANLINLATITGNVSAVYAEVLVAG
jgi:hypothetical protein